MGTLPETRLTKARIFCSVGIYYYALFFIKLKKQKNHNKKGVRSKICMYSYKHCSFSSNVI
jgi:hypothetical protein